MDQIHSKEHTSFIHAQCHKPCMLGIILNEAEKTASGHTNRVKMVCLWYLIFPHICVLFIATSSPSS